MRPDDDRLTRLIAPAVFALLLLATIAAFAYAQRLKREPLILDKVSFARPVLTAAGVKRVIAFTPNGDCRLDTGRIRFRVTRSDRADVQIIDSEGRLVRTLASDRFLKRYTFFTFYWSGRTREGKLAPPGRYKLRVKLLGQDRTLTPGGSLRLHAATARPGHGCPQPAGGPSA